MTDLLPHLATLEWRGTLASGAARFDTGISDLVLHPGPEGAMLYATTWRSGGISAWDLPEVGAARLAGTRALAGGQAAGAWRDLAVVEVEGAPELLLGSRADGQITRIPLSGGGLRAPGALGTGLAGESDPDLLRDSALVRDAAGRLFLSDGTGDALQVLRPDGQGGFAPAEVLRDTGATHLAGVTELATLELAGESLLLAASREERGISSFRLGGTVTHADSSGPGEGLGIMTPTDMACVTLEGRGYVILASAPEAGAGGALTVWEVSGAGELTPTDHLLDGLETRFGQVQSLSVVPVGERVYVLAGGGDDGITLFGLLPGGRLQLLGVMEDGLGTGLDGVQALAGMAAGEGLRVLVASQADAGIGEIAVDLPAAGIQALAPVAGGALTGGAHADILAGQGGDDRLTGGAGADILLDGAGRDLLAGGAGADLFVFVADGARDEIRDFDPARDRLDLSGWDFFHDPQGLAIRPLAGGAEITWREEVLRLGGAEGGALDPEAVRAAVLRGPDRPYRAAPGEISPGIAPGIAPGGDPEPVEGLDWTGSAAAERIWGGHEGDRLAGGGGADLLYGGGGGDRLLGGAGDDTLSGEAGPDALRGAAGADRLFGGAGADSLRGGGGADHLDGGAGDDRLFGGPGADLVVAGPGADRVFLGAGDDTFRDGAEAAADEVRAGPGDDRLEGGGGGDRLRGMGGADVIGGGAGADRLWGGAGDDSLTGGAGRDRGLGGAGKDLLAGGGGADLLQGNRGADRLTGGAGDDRLLGGPGADRLAGGGGADRLEGGAGADVIAGGGGADVFVFRAGSGGDRVTDFDPGLDRLLFGGIAPQEVTSAPGAAGLRISWEGGTVLLEGVAETPQWEFETLGG